MKRMVYCGIGNRYNFPIFVGAVKYLNKSLDMKKYFALAVAALVSCLLYGQNQEPFFPSAAGIVLEYENTDGNGKTVSVTVDSIVEFSGNFGSGRAVVLSSVTSLSDTVRVRSKVPYIFDRNEVIMDMAGLMREAMQEGMAQAMAQTEEGEDSEGMAEMREVLEQVKVSGECRGIPSDLSVGMKLPDYAVEIKVMFINTKMSCRDRLVTGRETITTPAGTFDCYVVEENMSVKSMMVSEKSLQKSWYARGIGVVRQETWEKKKLVETTVITAVR